MTVRAVVGGNWGDEGKGKFTDVFANQCDYVVRYQGGNNAGHTIVNPFGTFKLHLLPSGVFYPQVINVLATAVAVNLGALLQELDALIAAGVPAPKLCISNRAQVVMPWHPLLDALEEEYLAAEQFGSTRSGMAPFYADKYKKIGIQVCDLFDADVLKYKVEKALEHVNLVLIHRYNKEPLSSAAVLQDLSPALERIAPMVTDTQDLLYNAYLRGERILFEGQLGALKDPEHGIYPMTTSSSPLASFAPVSAGLPAQCLTQVTTVVKAYSSAVGEGPFVTEVDEDLASRWRILGNEFGAKTGRNRRIGWFDAVASRYGCRLQGTTEVVLSLLDVLGHFDTLKICTHYEIDGVLTDTFPTTRQLYKAQPVYETLPGWGTDISKVRSYEDLPEAARHYIKRVEALLGFDIRYISVGPGRDAVIER